jgi:hypothetical protein
VPTEGFDRGARGGAKSNGSERRIRYNFETQLGLITFLVGLIEGVAESYREPVKLGVIDEKTD